MARVAEPHAESMRGIGLIIAGGLLIIVETIESFMHMIAFMPTRWILYVGIASVVAGALVCIYEEIIKKVEREQDPAVKVVERK